MKKDENEERKKCWESVRTPTKSEQRMNEKEEKKFPLLKLQKVTPTVLSSV